MAELTPLKADSPVKLLFRFTVSDEWIANYVRETGSEPSPDWTVSFDLREIPDDDLRQQLCETHGLYSEVDWYPVLPYPTDEPEIMIQAIGNRFRQEAAERFQAQQHQAYIEAARKAQSDEWDQTRDRWIARNGSRRLQLASARAYKINRLYARERARMEFPAAWVDTGSKAKWAERLTPTEDALTVETEYAELIQLRGEGDRYSPRVVWLTEFPPDLRRWIEHNDWYVEGTETVIVEEYLDRYTLLLPVDTDLARTSVTYEEDE